MNHILIIQCCIFRLFQCSLFDRRSIMSGLMQRPICHREESNGCDAMGYLPAKTASNGGNGQVFTLLALEFWKLAHPSRSEVPGNNVGGLYNWGSQGAWKDFWLGESSREAFITNCLHSFATQAGTNQGMTVPVRETLNSCAWSFLIMVYYWVFNFQGLPCLVPGFRKRSFYEENGIVPCYGTCMCCRITNVLRLIRRWRKKTCQGWSYYNWDHWYPWSFFPLRFQDRKAEADKPCSGVKAG